MKLLALCLLISTAYGQTRINDKDLENLMRNLKEDAKSFRSPFKSGLEKSTVRKTSQAKDAEKLAESFANQTDSLLNNFKKRKKETRALAPCKARPIKSMSW